MLWIRVELTVEWPLGQLTPKWSVRAHSPKANTPAGGAFQSQGETPHGYDRDNDITLAQVRKVKKVCESDPDIPKYGFCAKWRKRLTGRPPAYYQLSYCYQKEQVKGELRGAIFTP